MKKRVRFSARSAGLSVVLVALFALFAYVAARSGPLAPVPVTAATVSSHSIAPALYGIGTVEARHTYRIGPTAAGRVRQVAVQVGDRVKAGQPLGEMDPVDLDERVGAQDAALRRAQSSHAAAQAQVHDTSARSAYADAQAGRYERLFESRAVSGEAVEAKRQEREIAAAALLAAKANVDAARQEVDRLRAERQGLARQRSSLKLVAPVDGLVTARDADPGTTVVAGQSVVELIDPTSLWVNVRFDQLRTAGLRTGLDARVVLRSQADRAFAARVARVEPVADAVTEETLAKVVFDALPESLPPIGELAEVTVALPALPAAPIVPNASVQRRDGRLGVWVIAGHDLRFAPVKLGASDLDGRVQVVEGLEPGERVVVHSGRALDVRSRFEVTARLQSPR